MLFRSSVDQVKENFSINGEQAESVIRQLETIGVLGSADADVHSGISSDVSACAGAVWTAGIGCAFHWHDHLSV